MLCPNCKKTLEEHTYDGINVQHCTYCGGTFFDQNEINRISLDSARDLAADRQAESISGAEKLCPIDHTVLKRTQQRSIPQHVSLLKCPKCKGEWILAPLFRIG
ncbi:MAG: zf-TFIIB domain-containing protein [Candidatus Paceibacterota bacterium]